MEQSLFEDVIELEELNRCISELVNKKESIENSIYSRIGHSIDGSKSYKVDSFIVTVTTGWNYRIVKDVYESLSVPEFLDPIIKVSKYEIDKKKYERLESSIASSQLLYLSKFIEKSPKKLNVKVRVGK